MDTVHECDRQTDRQTDGRTGRITITDTVQTASHGNNTLYQQYYICVCNVMAAIRFNLNVTDDGKFNRTYWMSG